MGCGHVAAWSGRTGGDDQKLGPNSSHGHGWPNVQGRRPIGCRADGARRRRDSLEESGWAPAARPRVLLMGARACSADDGLGFGLGNRESGFGMAGDADAMPRLESLQMTVRKTVMLRRNAPQGAMACLNPATETHRQTNNAPSSILPGNQRRFKSSGTWRPAVRRCPPAPLFAIQSPPTCPALASSTTVPIHAAAPREVALPNTPAPASSNKRPGAAVLQPTCGRCAGSRGRCELAGSRRRGQSRTRPGRVGTSGSCPGRGGPWRS